MIKEIYKIIDWIKYQSIIGSTNALMLSNQSTSDLTTDTLSEQLDNDILRSELVNHTLEKQFKTNRLRTYLLKPLLVCFLSCLVVSLILGLCGMVVLIQFRISKCEDVVRGMEKFAPVELTVSEDILNRLSEGDKKALKVMMNGLGSVLDSIYLQQVLLRNFLKLIATGLERK